MSARSLLILVAAAALLTPLSCLHAASHKVMKVLPHLLDESGRHAPAPSLYERDAHQAFLRANPEQIRGFRFDVQYRASAYYFTPRLRLEVRGSKEPRIVTFEHPFRRSTWFGRWIRIPVDRETFDRLGDVVAWRATLWDGEQLLAELKSFLW